MKFLRLISLMLLFGLLISFGLKSYKNAKGYESATAQIAAASDTTGLAKGKWDRLTSVISFGLIKNEYKERLNQLKKEQQRYQNGAKSHLYSFGAILGGILLISLFCLLPYRTLVFAFGSLVALIFGLINPILMVTIHKEIEHLGDVVLSFESKGIIGSIQKLFENGEVVVASTILLFSVVIPLLKIGTLIFTLFFRKFHFAHHLVNFFKHLGKWSMLDVFVVAIFLVYLTSNQGEVSRAEIQIGLYFFLIYVILSMITTILTQKVISPSSHPHALKTP